MLQKDKFSKTAIQHSFQYTLLISIGYAIIKFFDINSPDGTEFISYILPILYADIILMVFPFLFVFFYFKDGKAISDLKEHIFNGINYQSKEIDAREVLREYHNMLKEGILTQDEFDRVKKKYLKELNKD